MNKLIATIIATTFGFVSHTAIAIPLDPQSTGSDFKRKVVTIEAAHISAYGVVAEYVVPHSGPDFQRTVLKADYDHVSAYGIDARYTILHDDFDSKSANFDGGGAEG